MAELAKEAEVSEEEVLEALEAGQAYRFASLDAPGDDGPGRAASLGDDDPEFGRVEQRQLLWPLVARLPVRQQEIVRLRFVEDMTQYEIAERLGISQVHVSRLLARSLATLRALASTN